MSLRVAITRAAPAAQATAERVRALGAQPVLAPLLRIEPRAFDTDVSNAQALLFTSGHGVQALGLRNPHVRKITALAVGDATARMAREFGFAGVLSADGGVLELIEQAKHVLDPSGGKLIHISGAHVAGDLAGALREAGFAVERRIAYEAIAATELPHAFSQPLDIVLFHSARAAQTFVALEAPGAAGLTAACLSAAVADAAKAAPWRDLIVSPAPREDALLAAALGPHSPAGASA